MEVMLLFIQFLLMVIGFKLFSIDETLKVIKDNTDAQQNILLKIYEIKRNEELRR